jgi:hypothetical protein
MLLAGWRRCGTCFFAPLERAKKENAQGLPPPPYLEGEETRIVYIDNHYTHGLLQDPPRPHLRGMPHGTPRAGRSCLVWALRSVLSQNTPDEVGKRHTMRLVICQRVSGSFSPPLVVTRGGEVPGTASYTTQSSALGVPSHQVDVRAWQYRHPGLALYRECILYQI